MGSFLRYEERQYQLYPILLRDTIDNIEENIHNSWRLRMDHADNSQLNF